MEDITSEPRHSRRSLTTSELRLVKPDREAFPGNRRAPNSAVAIPVHGMANSLNVSTAAAILIHQLSNTWREQAGTELQA